LRKAFGDLIHVYEAVDVSKSSLRRSSSQSSKGIVPSRPELLQFLGAIQTVSLLTTLE
jgi:hypothetical protein